MHFHIITIFPQMFGSALSASVVRRALERGLIDISLYDLRDFTSDRHRTTDDEPYGGGAGMVMKVEPVAACLEVVAPIAKDARRIVLSPSGIPFSQEIAVRLAGERHLVLICGRYEGVDERVGTLVEEEISIGDYILSGGELPAMVVLDCVARLVPGVLGNQESARSESFSRGLLEHPQYTRPEDFRGLKVPPVLLSGDHDEIRRWRQRESIRRTRERRPDLYARFLGQAVDSAGATDTAAEAKRGEPG